MNAQLNYNFNKHTWSFKNANLDNKSQNKSLHSKSRLIIFARLLKIIPNYIV